MERTSVPGNKIVGFSGIIGLFVVMLLVFVSYKTEKVRKLKLVDKEIAVYESQLSEKNKLEIEGMQVK